MSRILSMSSAVSGVFLLVLSASMWTAQRATAEEVVVYKSPTCGCCSKWVEHMREHGFELTVNDLDRDKIDKIRREKGVPRELGSCHTAIVGGYAVEGHVPADVIKRLLIEHPPIVGVAVPGMPMGSPGMEGPNPQPYNILTFDTQGNNSVYDTR
jgi:hypothetical protein